MKKILYVCRNSRNSWETFIPQQDDTGGDLDISVVLLENQADPSASGSSRVYVLRSGEEGLDRSPSSQIVSYQDLLEKIFLTDVTVVL